MPMLGCINPKLAPFSAGALGFWWLRLPKGLCPMNFDLMLDKHPDSQHKKIKQWFKGFYTPQYHFGPEYTAG